MQSLTAPQTVIMSGTRAGRYAWPLMWALLFHCAAAHARDDRPQPGASREIRCMDFSPDGHLLAVAAGEPNKAGTLVVWDLATRSPRFVHQEDAGITSVAFAPDSRGLAIGLFHPTARLLDADSGRVLQTLQGHTDYVRSVAWSPDGKTLVTGSYDQTLKVWDIASGTATRTLHGHSGAIYSIAVSADGTRVASGSRDRTARLWDLKSGEPLQVFEQRSYIVRHVAFSADGRWLITGRYDGIVRIRDVESSQLCAKIQHGGGIQCAQLAPDNGILAVCSYSSSIKLFPIQLRPAQSHEQQQIENLITELNDRRYEIREAASRELLRIGMLAEPALRAAMTSSSAEVRARAERLREKVRSPKPMATLNGHPSEILSLCFSPDGRLLASGDRHGTIKLWDFRVQQELATLVLPHRKAGE